MRDLVEAVDRTKYGVNGSPGSLIPLPMSWRRKMNDFLVDSLSSQKQMRAPPMGPS